MGLVTGTTTTEEHTMEQAPNPVVKSTRLSAYAGWVVRERADGTFDAAQPGGVGLTIGVGSFAEAVAEVRQLVGGRAS
jgi:hypothetical protein